MIKTEDRKLQVIGWGWKCWDKTDRLPGTFDHITILKRFHSIVKKPELNYRGVDKKLKHTKICDL